MYKVIYSDKLVPSGFGDITLAPFAFMRPKHKGNKGLHKHVETHIKQQYKWLIVPYFIVYKLSKRMRLKWEVEAYREEIRWGQLSKRQAAIWLSTKYDLDISYHKALELLTYK